jgi:hypothetical protein
MASTFIPFVDDHQIHAIGCGLVQRTLPKSQWTHAAHFAAGLWLMELNASDAMPSVIRAYNVATGVANTDTSGYHETITRASLRAARAFRAERPHLPLFEVCNALMISRFGRSDWVLDHWSRERLFSKEARGSWLEPDLLPLPF